MPLHELDPDLAKQIEKFARLMVNSASVSASILGMALKRALFGEKSDVKFDNTILDTARERLWEITEDGFHKTLDDAIRGLSGEAECDVQLQLAEIWHDRLERAARAISMTPAPIDSFDTLEPKDIVEGRKQLVFSLKGYCKFGAEFFKALTLDPPEQKKKSDVSSKVKGKEDISQ